VIGFEPTTFTLAMIVLTQRKYWIRKALRIRGISPAQNMH